MKSIIIAVLFLATFALASWELPPSEVRFLKQVHDSCQADPKTYEDEGKLKNLVQNRNDPQVRVHMLCMGEKAGIVDHQGHANLAVLKEKLHLTGLNHDEVDNVISKCGNEKIAVDLWICIVQSNVPYYHKL